MNFKIIFLAFVITLTSCCTYFVSKKKREKYEEITKETVKDWIINNVTYPGSYKPISWNEFSFGAGYEKFKKIKNSDHYEINHIYYLMNNNQDLKIDTVCFHLDYQFKFASISKMKIDSTTRSYSYITNKWLEIYARE